MFVYALVGAGTEAAVGAASSFFTSGVASTSGAGAVLNSVGTRFMLDKML